MTHDEQWGPLCELYVMDALDDAQSEAFVGHAKGCFACGQALHREARFELGLGELASHSRAKARRPRRVARTVLGFAAAAAACLALVFARMNAGRRAPPLEAGRFDVTCLDTRTAADCVEFAQRHGLRVQYPARLAGIPRYELAGAKDFARLGDAHAP